MSAVAELELRAMVRRWSLKQRPVPDNDAISEEARNSAARTEPVTLLLPTFSNI
jgi:hypothetical protein